jgi:cyclophilin family peptidyl-prolyl cis-trans isomerase
MQTNPRTASIACRVLLVLAIGIPSLGRCQDAAQDYRAIAAEFSAINAKLDQLRNQYGTASPEQREVIRQEYSRSVAQANALVPRLRAAGIAAYRAAPNQDADLQRMLVSMVDDDVRHDRFDEALQLGQLLLENAVPNKEVLDATGRAAYGCDQFPLAVQLLKDAETAGVLSQEGRICLTDASLAAKLWAQEQAIRQREAAANDLPRVRLKTTKGDLVIELFENEAPQAVGNFVSLVEQGFYDGLSFHRVLPGFMAQGGCPDGTGSGGPGYDIYCECYQPNHRKHFRGTLSMAHAGKDTGGSQFFLTFLRTPHLDGRHTVFGRVIEGGDVLAGLQRRDPSDANAPQPDRIVEAKVLRKRDHPYAPTKVR